MVYGSVVHKLMAYKLNPLRMHVYYIHVDLVCVPQIHAQQKDRFRKSGHVITLYTCH